MTEINPAIIKKTQEKLGKFIKKPPLTDKLLKKPPFRFLHDIIIVIIKENGFFKDLLTDDEFDSANIKDRDAKIAFLQKIIDVVKLTTNAELDVKPSKIVAGLEPEKTNQLLQAIGVALEKKLDSSTAIMTVKNNDHDGSTITKLEKSKVLPTKKLTTKKSNDLIIASDSRKSSTKTAEIEVKSKIKSTTSKPAVIPSEKQQSRSTKSINEKPTIQKTSSIDKIKDPKDNQAIKKSKSKPSKSSSKPAAHHDGSKSKSIIEKQNSIHENTATTITDKPATPTPGLLKDNLNIVIYQKETMIKNEEKSFPETIITALTVESSVEPAMTPNKGDKIEINDVHNNNKTLPETVTTSDDKQKTMESTVNVDPINEPSVTANVIVHDNNNNNNKQTELKSDIRGADAKEKENNLNNKKDKQRRKSSAGKEEKNLSKENVHENDLNSKLGITLTESSEKFADIQESAITTSSSGSNSNINNSSPNQNDEILIPVKDVKKSKINSSSNKSNNKPTLTRNKSFIIEKADDVLTTSSNIHDDSTLTDKTNPEPSTEPPEPTMATATTTTTNNDTKQPTRPRTSLRPPSVRPASARPGAPRRRRPSTDQKTIEIMLEPIKKEPPNITGINVKIDNFNSELMDDDGENLIIIENSTETINDSNNEIARKMGMIDGSNTTFKIQLDGDDVDENIQKGHLVQQILETQKEFSTFEMDILTKQQQQEQQIGEYKMENSSTNARESLTSAKHVDKLRDSIQKLTRSVNPLGKLMDFLQEDIDSMQMELQMWQQQYDAGNRELKKEKSLNSTALEPFKHQLTKIELNIKDQIEMINQSRANILQNNEKIFNLFSEL